MDPGRTELSPMSPGRTLLLFYRFKRAFWHDFDAVPLGRAAFPNSVVL